jgi:glycosyltransferase involved in cell wall biosynthesis
MKILLVHNYYQQSGGEDQVYHAEKQLLEDANHQVFVYERNNDEISQYTTLQRISLAGKTVWAGDSRNDIYNLFKRHNPDIVHFHNTFPLISPSVYSLGRQFGAGIIQTLHNFRYLCPNALFFREGRPCEDCLGKAIPWPGVLHACYRNSRLQTAVTGAMLATHRAVRTLEQGVDRFIALSHFSRSKFIAGGFPADRIVVKPNFVHPDPGVRNGSGEFFMFVGRLSPEKGVITLLKAVRRIGGLPLRIVGDGPIYKDVQELIQKYNLKYVDLCGRLSHEETLNQMKEAKALILPSECYENFPLAIAEALACGVPVIASRLGGTQELVQEGKTGLLFTPGDVEELADKIEWMGKNPEETFRMGSAARQVYETRYSADVNYQQLSAIYESVLEEKN